MSEPIPFMRLSPDWVALYAAQQRDQERVSAGVEDVIATCPHTMARQLNEWPCFNCSARSNGE